MWRTVCKFISLLAVCALLLGLCTGCAQAEPEDVERFRKLFNKGIIAENPILIREMDDNEERILDAHYIEIDGLKNKETQDRINGRIKEVFDEMLNMLFLPPYRGIAVKLREAVTQPKIDYIIMSTKYNSGNLLCVTAKCWVSFRSDANESVSYNYCVPLNFSLVTGEELRLADFFDKGTNYVEAVNKAAERALMKKGYGSDDESDFFVDGTLGDVKMTSPFRGIRPEPKFTVSGSGALGLVIDYDTPEFYTDFSCDYIWLESDELTGAFTPMIPCDEDLYESDDIVCRFAGKSYENPDEEKNFSRSDYAGGDFFGTCYYRDGTPEAVRKRINKLTFDAKYVPFTPETIQDFIPKKGKPEDFRIEIYSHTECDMTKSGEYFSFTKECTVWVDYDAQGEEESYSNFYEQKTSYCLDKEGNTIEPERLFVRSDVYEKAVIKAMIAGMKKTSIAFFGEVYATDRQLENLAVELLLHIDGAALESQYMRLSFDLPLEQLHDLWKKHTDIPYPYLRDQTIDLMYSDLGCENLVCFRDAFV